MKKIKIPLFPLNIVVLPYEKVPLLIFEPRYKKMISESQYFLGKHNLEAFRSIDCQSTSANKTIKSVNLIEKKNKIIITVCAKSFGPKTPNIGLLSFCIRMDV